MPRSDTPSSAGFVRASPGAPATPPCPRDVVEDPPDDGARRSRSPRQPRAPVFRCHGSLRLVHAASRGDQAMFQAALYDLIYMSMKDYSAEAGQIADLLRRARPHCRTLLDVGCGTGEHARLLGEVHGFEVDGVDIDPAMLAIARTRSHGRFDVADMTDFHLGRCYDGVLNLFGAI